MTYVWYFVFDIGWATLFIDNDQKLKQYEFLGKMYLINIWKYKVKINFYEHLMILFWNLCVMSVVSSMFRSEVIKEALVSLHMSAT